MNLRNYVLIGMLLSISILSTSCRHKPKEDPLPNIIIILADDLGYGDISGFHDGNKIKTPHIASIAAEGIKFTDAHTPSAVCTPTRYGLLTGRYNWRSRLKSGVLTGKSQALIPKSRSTIASILQGKGYHTAFIGKWHLGWDWGKKEEKADVGEGWDAKDFDNIDFTKPVTHTPNDIGFNYAYGHAGSLDMAPYVYVENGHVTAIPDTSSIDTGKYSWWRKGPTAPDFVHEDVTPNFFRRAITYIADQAKEEQPFFLYLPLPSPHTPILPTPAWQGKSGLHPYADFVLMIDAYVGQLLEVVEKAGISKHTLIIFTSDNGCSPAVHLDELTAQGHYPSSIYRGHKADIFEGGHRVPFVARWPEKIKAGAVSKETICLTDMMATFAEIAHRPLRDNEGEDSYSLLPIFEGKTLPTSLREATVHHSINGSFAIRQGDWKLILCPGSGGWSAPQPGNKAARDTLPHFQLYNLATDPSETTNLQASHPERANQLKALLLKYISEGRSTPGPQQENDSIDFVWKQVERFH